MLPCTFTCLHILIPLATKFYILHLPSLPYLVLFYILWNFPQTSAPLWTLLDTPPHHPHTPPPREWVPLTDNAGWLQEHQFPTLLLHQSGCTRNNVGYLEELHQGPIYKNWKERKSNECCSTPWGWEVKNAVVGGRLDWKGKKSAVTCRGGDDHLTGNCTGCLPAAATQVEPRGKDALLSDRFLALLLPPSV